MCKTPVSFGLKDFYQSYKRKHPHSKVDSKMHRLILEKAGDNIRETLLEDGEFKLGNRAGVLMIRMVVPRVKPFDYAHYNLTGEKRYFNNDHTDGNVAKVLWNRRNAILFDKHMWEFSISKQFRIDISEGLYARELIYPMYHNYQSI